MHAGLNRTGKSCRLRWLNYLRPDVRRGNITAEEHELIVELQGRWGNRWSKIARHLPGRTDNEIKNFWRTKIQNKRGGAGTSESAGHQLGYVGHGGGGGASAGGVSPEFLQAAVVAAGDGFWDLEEFWPTAPSLHGHF